MSDVTDIESGSRRAVLRSIGALSTGTLVGLAGCGGDDNGDGGDDGNGGISGEDYPEIDEWLTETDVGGSDSNYEGTLLDRRGEDAIAIDVGAEGNGDGFAFSPAAVVVSTGTDVTWEWTGEGGQHNVEAEPDDQLGESDYEFSSGEAESGEAVQFTYTLDDAGIALYHCEPHLAQGMKGGIGVEESG